MTNYIRFFHVELYHLRFVGIEALVTLAVLLLFILLPVRSLAFFPEPRFPLLCTEPIAGLRGRLPLVLDWPDCAAADRAVYHSQHS